MDKLSNGEIVFWLIVSMVVGVLLGKSSRQPTDYSVQVAQINQETSIKTACLSTNNPDYAWRMSYCDKLLNQ